MLNIPRGALSVNAQAIIIGYNLIIVFIVYISWYIRSLLAVYWYFRLFFHLCEAKAIFLCLNRSK